MSASVPPPQSSIHEALTEGGGLTGLRDTLYSAQGGRCGLCSDDYTADLLTVAYVHSIGEDNPTGEAKLRMLCQTCDAMLGAQPARAPRARTFPQAYVRRLGPAAPTLTLCCH